MTCDWFWLEHLQVGELTPFLWQAALSWQQQWWKALPDPGWKPFSWPEGSQSQLQLNTSSSDGGRGSGLVVPGMEPSLLHLLGKRSSTELQPQLWVGDNAS